MVRQKLLIFFQITVLLFILPSSVSAKITAEAFLDSTSFPVTETARLTVTVTGARSASITLPEVNGVRFHSRGQSSQFTVINGSYTSSISNTYLVEPLSTGQYTIPPISVTAGNTTLHTSPINFKVTGKTGSGTALSDPSSVKRQLAFIRLSHPGRHYTGEVIPLTIKVYFNSEYRININSLPVLEGDGVVMNPLDSKPRRSREVIGTTSYNVLSWNTSVSGIKAGTHPIRFSLDATVMLPVKRRSVSPFNDIFNDPFFDSFFGGLEEKPIKVGSKPLNLEIADLPEKGKPDNFTGAIGNFELSVSAEPRQVLVGEPITLTIEIKGKGNFDRVEPPVLPDATDWKTYSPTSEFLPGQDSISGKKKYEQAIVAKNDRIKEIPPLSFSFFNPEQQSYVTVSSSPIPVRITQPADLSAAVQITEKKSPPPALDLHADSPKTSNNPKDQVSLLHLESGTFHRKILPIYRKLWFQLLGAGCIVLLIIIAAVKTIKQNRQNNPERQKLKKRRDLLSRDLQKLKQARKNGNSDLFLTLCRQTIQLQLGLHWDKIPSAITLADIEKRLNPPSRLTEIFAAAEQQRYGGDSISPQQMDEYLEQLRHELEGLL